MEGADEGRLVLKTPWEPAGPAPGEPGSVTAGVSPMTPVILCGVPAPPEVAVDAPMAGLPLLRAAPSLGPSDQSG